MEKSLRYAVIIFLSIFFINAGFLFYANYNLTVKQEDFQSRVLKMNQDIADELQSLRTVLQSQIELLNYNLSTEIGYVSVDLEDFKRQNQLQINALSSLIDQIEKQSNIQLNELKDEVKGIQIKSADFSAIIDDVLQSVVSVKTNLGQGSGVVISDKGYIVTNVHVIEGASFIRATTYSGKTYDAALIGYDQTRDVALLKIDAPNLQALNYGAEEVKVGQKVLAAGNPAGLAFTVTEGIVSAFRTFSKVDYIQTDVPINPGNSGGPLINAKGEIIGINNFKVGGFEGLGFAISANDVREVTDKLIREYEANNP